MLEFADIVIYLKCLEARILHQFLEQIRVASPFVLRTVSPRPEEFQGRQVVGLSRMGKRVP